MGLREVYRIWAGVRPQLGRYAMAQKEKIIIPFDELGTMTAREGHWTASFGTGIGNNGGQFTIERENFGDADSPMLTHVLSDRGMEKVAELLGKAYASVFREHEEDFDGDFDAFMDSSFGEDIWRDYERIVHGFVPYLDELQPDRLHVGDRVFDVCEGRYGVIAAIDGDSATLEDGTETDPLFLLKETDKIFQ